MGEEQTKHRRNRKKAEERQAQDLTELCWSDGDRGTQKTEQKTKNTVNAKNAVPFLVRPAKTIQQYNTPTEDQAAGETTDLPFRIFSS